MIELSIPVDSFRWLLVALMIILFFMPLALRAMGLKDKPRGNDDRKDDWRWGVIAVLSLILIFGFIIFLMPIW